MSGTLIRSMTRPRPVRFLVSLGRRAWRGVRGTGAPFGPTRSAARAGLDDGGAPEGAPGRWLGYIDRVEHGVIQGWCCDAADMERSVSVEARGPSGRRAVVVANLHRQDVQEAGFGHGRYGFAIDMRTLGVKNETIEVRVLDSRALIGSVPVSHDACGAVLTHSFPDPFLALMRSLAADLQAKHAEMVTALAAPSARAARSDPPAAAARPRRSVGAEP